RPDWLCRPGRATRRAGHHRPVLSLDPALFGAAGADPAARRRHCRPHRGAARRIAGGDRHRRHRRAALRAAGAPPEAGRTMTAMPDPREFIDIGAEVAGIRETLARRRWLVIAGLALMLLAL